MSKKKSLRPLDPPAPVSHRTLWIPFLLILAFAVQSLWHAWDKSPTYDESGHLTVSFLLEKTPHQDYDIGHPPLIRYLFSIPLLFLQPSMPTQMPPPMVPPEVPLRERPSSAFYVYTSYFLFGNRVPAQTLVFWPRMVNVLLGCLLGVWIYLWSKKLYGEKGGIFSLILFAFCPNLIAHSSLVTTDIGGITFAVGFLYAFTLLLESRNIKNMLLTGLLLGLALVSKYTNLFLVPLFAGTFYFLEKRFSNRPHSLPVILKTIGIVFITAWLVVCLAYRFENVFSPHMLQPEDWENLHMGSAIQSLYRITPMPDSFLRGVCFAVYHDHRGHASYLNGQYSNAGWWNYFPIAFSLKTPLTILSVLLGTVSLLILKKIRFVKTEALILLPVLFLIGTAMTAKINIGIRHILLCYPLLYVFSGKLQTLEFLNGRRGIQFSGLLSVLLAFETLSVSPHYLAFFNLAAGGPAGGVKFLSDSNIDWGQDINNLAKFLQKEGNPEVLLSYFGTDPPQYYGIQFQALPTVWSYPKSEHLNSIQPQKEFCAVSVTNLQGTYFLKHDLYAWLKEKKPIQKIGYSIYVYDITHDLESQEKILEIYKLTGEPEKILRQTERIKQFKIKV